MPTAKVGGTIVVVVEVIVLRVVTVESDSWASRAKLLGVAADSDWEEARRRAGNLDRQKEMAMRQTVLVGASWWLINRRSSLRAQEHGVTLEFSEGGGGAEEVGCVSHSSVNTCRSSVRMGFMVEVLVTGGCRDCCSHRTIIEARTQSRQSARSHHGFRKRQYPGLYARWRIELGTRWNEIPHGIATEGRASLSWHDSQPHDSGNGPRFTFLSQLSHGMS